jgi:hypothetical protein
VDSDEIQPENKEVIMAKRGSRGKKLTVGAKRGTRSQTFMYGNYCANLVFELRVRKSPKKPAPKKK